MTHHLKQTEPTLFPNEQEPERESNAWHIQSLQDADNSYVVKQVPGYIAADCPTKECADHIKNCLNIIQSLADSLGVNAVELAQRMEGGNVIQEILLVLRAFNHPDHKLDCQDILSKLEGTNK